MYSNPPDTDADQAGADLSLRFGATMTELDTTPQAMAADAIRAGRPLRRRRVTASVAGGVVALALVGSVGAYGISAVSTTTRTAVPAGSPTVMSPPPTTSVTPTEKAPSSAPPRGTAKRQLPARVGALYLTRLAPSGTVESYVGQQSDDEIYVGAPLDRGDGVVGLEINVQGAFFGATTGPGPKQDPKAVAEFYTCKREFEHYTSCSVSHRDDGSILLTSTRIITKSRPAAVNVVADLLRADGTRVVVSTGNTADVKYGGDVRRGVTVAQAEKIAIDPVWDLYSAPTGTEIAQAKHQITPWKTLTS